MTWSLRSTSSTSVKDKWVGHVQTIGNANPAGQDGQHQCAKCCKTPAPIKCTGILEEERQRSLESLLPHCKRMYLIASNITSCWSKTHILVRAVLIVALKNFTRILTTSLKGTRHLLTLVFAPLVAFYRHGYFIRHSLWHAF